MTAAFFRWLDKTAYFLFAKISGFLRGWRFMSSIGGLLGIPNVGARAMPLAELQCPRILVISPEALGDLLVTVPLIVGLRTVFPSAHLVLLVASPWQSLIAKLTAVDEVLSSVLHTGRWNAIGNIRRAIGFGRAVLRPRKFDLAICPRWDADFTDAFLLAFLSYAPVRVAFSEKSTEWRKTANLGQDQFFTCVLSDDGSKHESARSFHLLKLMGFDVPPDAQLKAMEVAVEDLARAELKTPVVLPTGCPVVAVFPGVKDRIKQWPVERFAEAARLVLERRNIFIVVCGGEQEVEKCREFCHSYRGAVLNLCNRVDLCDLPGILRQCAVVLSCDSGGSHLAGMLNIPVVVIFSQPPSYNPFGFFSPLRFTPLGRYVSIVQPPEIRMENECHGAYPVTRVAPAEVARILLGILDGQFPSYTNPDSSKRLPD